MSDHSAERILIVDDEEYTRDILSRMLTAAGYSCVTCADGWEALKKLACRDYALMLVGYKMPGLSGEEILREVAALYPGTAAIMVTAIADVGPVIKLVKTGVCDYLAKPVDPDMLYISVNRALEKRRLQVENRCYQTRLEEKVSEHTGRIRNNLLNSITSLAFALEAKDVYTSGHSKRVSGIAVAIAKAMGLGAGQVEQIRFAGLVHDIGKIGTREIVLNKNEVLTDEEYCHITAHSVVGERILGPIMEDETIPRMVRCHHERYDGWGYPDQLQGEAIPLGARILAVADTYDAMTSDRPYRRAVSHKIALHELELKAGSQFDTVVVEAFLGMKDTDMAWITTDQLALGLLSG